ncbi:phosphonate C-P lyase system protein PhnH [Albimonas pacifica]|uniref:Alpha-D-ribose 1-methylphosphonate 5-triphosphate synthase subunit PhnH n=1 Tax=Albimonas pacifica TaxID=1114924 RepID=A0A1I3GA79_9RHOB|nr:phosphonate C-P lyase system protein PhnH [Albimonas pacifica]SFI20408.1 alpha-D-ribose 1-methylphosphonate 5-triphosphate synthase subunit PhnH [Albimonas pacifica]
MTAFAAEALDGAFADAPAEASRAFRAALDAMSRPGTLQHAGGARPPAPLPPAAGALALTLVDAETPVWLAPELRAGPVEAWLRFHCNAPLNAAPEAAAFAFGSPASLLAELDRFAIGTPEYPDRSTTLVVLLDAFEGAEAELTGPGIRGTARLALGSSRAEILALAAPNRALFPQGRDLFLAAEGRLAALPRSTRLREV